MFLVGFSALSEAIAVTVHFQDGDVVRQPIKQGTGKVSEPKVSVHSSKGRLLVIRVDDRS